MAQSRAMTQLLVVPTPDLLAAHEQQIRSFIRIHWHDEFACDIDGPLIPHERHGMHFLIAERHALFSHARVHQTRLSHRGQTYQLHCLGDVFTYPAFRRRGYGTALVAAATERIRTHQSADLGILFCDPANADFYARHGWRPAPALRVMRGFEEPEPQEGLPMLMPVSAAGHRCPVVGELQLPGFGW